MVREPSGEIGLAGLHGLDGDGIALEEIGQDTKVAVGGELIGQELGVDVDTEDVTQDDDGFLGGLVVLGVDQVGVDCDRAGIVSLDCPLRRDMDRCCRSPTAVDLLALADGSALMLEAGGTARSRGVRSHCVWG